MANANIALLLSNSYYDSLMPDKQSPSHAAILSAKAAITNVTWDNGLTAKQANTGGAEAKRGSFDTDKACQVKHNNNSCPVMSGHKRRYSKSNLEV